MGQIPRSAERISSYFINLVSVECGPLETTVYTDVSCGPWAEMFAHH